MDDYTIGRCIVDLHYEAMKKFGGKIPPSSKREDKAPILNEEGKVWFGNHIKEIISNCGVEPSKHETLYEYEDIPEGGENFSSISSPFNSPDKLEKPDDKNKSRAISILD